MTDLRESAAPPRMTAASPELRASRVTLSAPDETWREAARRWVMAAVVGAAVIVAPGGPSPGRGPGWQPPAYVRALRWRDIIRLRLSPWLLSGVFGPPPDGAHRGGPSPDRPAAGAPPFPYIPLDPRQDPPGEPRTP